MSFNVELLSSAVWPDGRLPYVRIWHRATLHLISEFKLNSYQESPNPNPNLLLLFRMPKWLWSPTGLSLIPTLLLALVDTGNRQEKST